MKPRIGLILQLFLRSSRVQRKRAALTIASIAWGTLALLLLLSFGEGLSSQLGRAEAGMGKDIAVIWPGETGRAHKGMPPGRPIRPRVDDVALLAERIPDLEGVVGEIRSWRVSLTNGRKTVNSRVTGTTPPYGDMRNHFAKAGGRFLNDEDEKRKRRVVFLGEQLAKDLYGTEEPVGRVLLLNGTPYTVIGVSIHKMQMGMYSGPDADHAVIPLATFEAQYGSDRLSNIVLRPSSPGQMKSVLRQVNEILGARYGFDPEDERALQVWDTVETGRIFNNIVLGIDIFLGVIGGLTLMIGGVGVANIMYATVKERTREIGVRMAMGARPGWITGPLVLEGLLYTLLGGFIGLIAATGAISLLGMIPTEGNEALEMLGKPVLSLRVGLLAAALLGFIGLLAGYFPARRAAAIDPAETLRYE